MKRKILEIELLGSITILLYCFLWFFLDIFDTVNDYEILYIMIVLALANFIGFFIRIFTHQSYLMGFYFFGVIAFFLLLFIILFLGASPDNIFFKIYFYGGSLLLSFYYSISGFLIIREIVNNSRVI